VQFLPPVLISGCTANTEDSDVDAEELVTQTLRALVGRDVDSLRSYCAPELLATWSQPNEERCAEHEWPFLDHLVVEVESPAQDGTRIVHAAVKKLAPWMKADKVYGVDGIDNPTAVHEVALSVRDGEIHSISWGGIHWGPKSKETWLVDLRAGLEARRRDPRILLHAVDRVQPLQHDSRGW
jgi:hypothetical protein